MSQVMLWWVIGLGPIYFILLGGLYLARHCFPDERILFELSESMVIIAAAVLATAAAGLWAQIL